MGSSRFPGKLPDCWGPPRLRWPTTGIVPSDRVPDFGLSTGITLIASSASRRLEVLPVAYEGSFPVWTETRSATLPTLFFPFILSWILPTSPSTKPIRACELEYIIRPASWTTDPRACSRDDGVVLISADRPSHSCRTSPPIYEEYAASGQVPVCANCRIRDWKACLPGTLRLWGSSCRAECRMLASSGCSALGPHEVNEGCICHEARWRYEPINRWREVIGSRARLRSGQHSTSRDHVELEELSVSFRHGILRLETGDGAALSSPTEPRSATTAVHLSMTDGLNGRSLASCLLVVGRPGKNKPRPHLFRLEHGKMFRVFLSPCQACLITLSRHRATS